MTRALDHIAAMAPYALAEMAPPDGKPLVSLSQNESLRPPSPLVNEAVARALTDGALYPDPDWAALRIALGAVHGIAAEQILCGNGSLDLIGCLARCFAGPGKAVLSSAHAYPFFRSATQMTGARFDVVPEQDATIHVDAMLAAQRPDTALVFVANPGNPTGTRIPKSELLRLRAGLRDDVLLVIDEAYGEFADHLGEPMFDMVAEGETVVLRTFSKAYGLAGYRVGWGLFPPLVAMDLRKVMNPNNVSMAAQVAAVAALGDQEYLAETCLLTEQQRDAASDRLRDPGLRVYESCTNFVLIDMETTARATAADAALRAEGVFLRPQTGAGLPHCLRMTIGSTAAVGQALDVLKNWVQEGGHS